MIITRRRSLLAFVAIVLLSVTQSVPANGPVDVSFLVVDSASRPLTARTLKAIEQRSGESAQVIAEQSDFDNDGRITLSLSPGKSYRVFAYFLGRPVGAVNVRVSDPAGTERKPAPILIAGRKFETYRFTGSTFFVRGDHDPEGLMLFQSRAPRLDLSPFFPGFRPGPPFEPGVPERAGVLDGWLDAVLAPAHAQQTTGNLYGTITDNQGEALPGSTVTLAPVGGGPTRIQISNAQGQLQFLNLPPGNYKLQAQLDGFSTVEYPNVNILVSRNTSLEAELSPAIEETITVTSEAPLLDERKINTGATVSQAELEKIPTARDPWSVLQTVPGVLTDRINVGGNESGQQSMFTGAGSNRQDNVWAVDGVVITDMAAVGASSTYYDFDAFEDLQFSTGGADVAKSRSGVSVNLVTKRGTNDFRGGGRFLLTEADGYFGAPDSPNGPSITDMGAEFSGDAFTIGGPVVKDRLWFWGAHGQNDIKSITSSAPPEPSDTRFYVQDTPLTTNFGLRFDRQESPPADGSNAPDDGLPQSDLDLPFPGTSSTESLDWEDITPRIGITYALGAERKTLLRAGLAQYPEAPAQDPGNAFSGTVTGMYHPFNPLADIGTLDPDQAAGGWGDALDFIPVQNPNAYLFSADFFLGGLPQPSAPKITTYRGSVRTFTPPAEDEPIDDWQLFKESLEENDDWRVSRESLADEIFDDWRVDGSYYFGSGSVNHEIKFGARLRSFDVDFAYAENGSASEDDYWDVALRYAGEFGAIRVVEGGTGTVKRAGDGNAVTQRFDLFDQPTFSAQTTRSFELGGVLPAGGERSFLDPPITDELLLGVEHAFLPEFVTGAKSFDPDSDFLYFGGPPARRTVERDLIVIDPSGGALGAVGARDTFNQGGVTWDLYYSGEFLQAGPPLGPDSPERDYEGLSINFSKRLSNRWSLGGNFTYSDWEIPADRGGEADSAQTSGLASGEPEPEPDRLPSDPYYHASGHVTADLDDQWGLKRIGFTASGRDGNETLWPKQATPVIVAVVDTGIDFGHPDLFGALWANLREIPNNGLDDDNNGFVDDFVGWNFVDDDNNTRDNNGHGTFVAGLIGAANDNSIGIAGVNPWARIMPVKVLDFDNRGHSLDVAKGIIYAARMGAQVINVSIGGRTPTQLEAKAMEYAGQLGALVIVAAGNKDVDTKDYSPAGLASAITVTATDVEDQRATFSNWGTAVDIAAPGVDILSLRGNQTDLLQFATRKYVRGTNVVGRGRYYYHTSGTSFAAPLVTGVASLIWAVRPQLTAEEVRRMLLHSARDIDAPGLDQYTGYGLLNAGAALAADPAFFIDAAITGVRLVEHGGKRYVQVLGTADADALKQAWIEIGAGQQPDRWRRVPGVLTEGVQSGPLIDIEAGSFQAAKEWTLRLITEHDNGRRRETRYVLTLG